MSSGHLSEGAARGLEGRSVLTLVPLKTGQVVRLVRLTRRRCTPSLFRGGATYSIVGSFRFHFALNPKTVIMFSAVSISISVRFILFTVGLITRNLFSLKFEFCKSH